MEFMTFQKQLGMSSSQLTWAYVSKGWLNHQPVLIIPMIMILKSWSVEWTWHEMIVGTFVATNCWLVCGLEHLDYFSISYMGCHPKPIDELHHFSRWLKWLLHHQPVDIVLFRFFLTSVFAFTPAAGSPVCRDDGPRSQAFQKCGAIATARDRYVMISE